VLHSPQDGHFPCHFWLVLPHSRHLNIFDRKIRNYSLIAYRYYLYPIMFFGDLD
jgi:hypothetical protein